MGNYLTGNMKENMRKTQEAQMEKQIQMQFQMQKRAMAMQLARSRDFYHWISAFSAIVVTGLFMGFRRSRNPNLLIPLVPITFVNLYNYDLAYGNKIHRIRIEAEHIMNNETDALEWPCGLPTLSSINQELRREDDPPTSSQN